jgi:hypothetical protein
MTRPSARESMLSQSGQNRLVFGSYIWQTGLPFLVTMRFFIVNTSVVWVIVISDEK